MKRGQDGMTVIEVLVAMVILVVGVLGIFSMLDTGNNVTARNLTREAGTSLAREGSGESSRPKDPGYVACADVSTRFRCRLGAPRR